MAFKKFRLAIINGYDEDGYPTLQAGADNASPFFALHTPAEADGESEEVNNVSLQIEETLSTKTLQADDRTEVKNRVTGYTATYTGYVIDAEPYAKIFGQTLDTNKNIVKKSGAIPPHLVGFYEGANEKGKRFQMWLYDLQAQPMNDADSTESDSAENISITFNGSLVELKDGSRIEAAIVYEGNNGWVSGEPTASSLYKEAKTSSSDSSH